MPELWITDDQGARRVHRIDGTVEFGRAESCDIGIHAPGVSRRHGRFLLAPDGSWWVEDLQSKNGILINGRQTTRHRLRDGDLLTVGNAAVAFHADTAPPAQRTGVEVTISDVPRLPHSTLEHEPATATRIEARRLGSLYEISRQLLNQRDVRGLIEVACSSLIGTLEAGVVVIGLTCDPQRDKDLLFVRPPNMQHAGVTLSLSVLRRTLEARKSVLVAETSSDERMLAAQSIVFGGIQSALCVPLMQDQRVTGFIYVDSRRGPRRYNTEDLDFASAVGSLVGTAVEVARLHEAEIAKERMEAELAAARRVQQAILPSSWPTLPGWEVWGHHQSCREVGGDYYDAIPTEDGRLWLVVADVCGKGAPAALLASSIHTAVHALVGHCSSPAELLTRVNALLLRREVEESFVTCLIAAVDPRSGSAIFASAGHPVPLWAGCRTGPEPLRFETGMVLGAMGETAFPQTAWHFPAEGGSLLMYTDGISEAMSPEEEQFGEGRMLQVIGGSGSVSAQELAEHLLGRVEQFRGCCPQSDDLTVLVCRRLPAE
jgi:sigma-B regulation protein RsbU (phosphoserine phosphatase)